MCTCCGGCCKHESSSARAGAASKARAGAGTVSCYYAGPCPPVRSGRRGGGGLSRDWLGCDLHWSVNFNVATMKLIIERAALLKALSHVQSVVERRTTIPILSNVLLRAEAGRLALSATDMDLEIIERVSGQIERDGRTTP